jgi:methionyl-tRNA formyltransferase
MFGETPIKILRAHSAEGKNIAPGTVMSVDKKQIIVACGNGALALEVLQKPGGKAFPVAQFVQGFPIKAGDCFRTG